MTKNSLVFIADIKVIYEDPPAHIEWLWGHKIAALLAGKNRDVLAETTQDLQERETKQ